jgi:hypothetical protein
MRRQPDPGQVWQAALDQLQDELPRASFETWVRDTQALSCRDGLLTIACRNAYARDWLESRLSARLARLLDGGRAEFVVAGQADPESDPEPEEAERGSLSIQPLDLTRYQDEVQPERVVVLPGYALRLLEQGDLSPKQMSLWVGFRQAVYQRWKRGQGTVKHIPYWEAARFAMMSRASYFRELRGRTELAGGLVELVPESFDARPAGDARFDNANCYRVHMSPRLTRRDCAVLEKLLTAEISQAAAKPEACEIALAVLNDLAERDPAEYLEGSAPVGKAWPRSLAEIVCRVVGLEGGLPADLAQAAERVHDRILAAFGKVFITHYFLRTVVPALELTHPQAWAVILLRDRCWYDYAAQSQKEFALVPGGLKTVAKWVGVTAESVGDWLRKTEFSAFVHQADMSLLDEIPDAWREKNMAIFLVSQQEPILADESPEKCDPDSGKVRLAHRKSETRLPEKCDSELGKVRLALRKSETRLNNSIKPLLNPNKPQESPPPARRRAQARAGVGSLAFWDFGFLMANNAVHPGSVRNLLKANQGYGRDLSSLANGFVSWLLYAYTPAGARVNDPVGLAVKRLQENLYAGSGPEMDKLAALRPADLKSLFDQPLAGQLAKAGSLEADIFADNFGCLEQAHLRQLYRRLFGQQE